MAAFERSFFDRRKTTAACCKFRHPAVDHSCDRCDTYHYDALHSNDLRLFQCSCTLLHLHIAVSVKIGLLWSFGAASMTELPNEEEQYWIR